MIQATPVSSNCCVEEEWYSVGELREIMRMRMRMEISEGEVMKCKGRKR